MFSNGSGTPWHLNHSPVPVNPIVFTSLAPVFPASGMCSSDAVATACAAAFNTQPTPSGAWRGGLRLSTHDAVLWHL